VVLDGVGDGRGEGVHEGFGFGFDHDAGESFGAGVADDDASVAVELAFGVGDGLLNGGHGGEGKFFADANVADDLREDFESVKEFVEGAAGAGHDFHDAEGGEEAVAGGGFAVAEEDVAGLLSAKNSAGFLHLFENVFVADVGAKELDAIVAEGDFESHVGHGGGDDG